MSGEVAARDYQQRGVWPRWRLRLTMIGLLALPFISWRWGSSQPALWSYPFGAAVTILGVSLRLWAAGWLRKNQALVMGGPYARTRNPLYLGTAGLAAGHGLMSAVPLAPLIFPALCFIVYYPAMREEEAYLSRQYGDDFEIYRARVPLLLPHPRKSSLLNKGQGVLPVSMPTDHFSWQQIKRNREYEAAIINIAMIVFYGWLNQIR